MFKKFGDPTPITRIIISGDDLPDNEETKIAIENARKSINHTNDDKSTPTQSGKTDAN
jgi:hypothetical protein